MAKPKITKLSDPSNPYGGKKTPTRARTPAEQMDAAARSKKQPERARQRDRDDTPAPRTRRDVINQAVDRANEGKGRKK